MYFSLIEQVLRSELLGISIKIGDHVAISALHGWATTISVDLLNFLINSFISLFLEVVFTFLAVLCFFFSFSSFLEIVFLVLSAKFIPAIKSLSYFSPEANTTLRPLIFPTSPVAGSTGNWAER